MKHCYGSPRKQQVRCQRQGLLTTLVLQGEHEGPQLLPQAGVNSSLQTEGSPSPLQACFPPRGSEEKQGVRKAGIGSLRCLMEAREASDIMASCEALPRGPEEMCAFPLVSTQMRKDPCSPSVLFKIQLFHQGSLRARALEYGIRGGYWAGLRDHCDSEIWDNRDTQAIWVVFSMKEITIRRNPDLLEACVTHGQPSQTCAFSVWLLGPYLGFLLATPA